MSGRQVRIILGVLAALVAVWAGRELFEGGGGDESASLGLAVAVDSTVSEVRIVSPGGAAGAARASGGAEADRADTLRLALTPEGARVNGFPADSAGVARLLRSLDTTRVRRVVARNPENHARLGVSDDAARRVEIGGPASPAFTLLVGDRGRGGRFVRRAGSDRVFVLEGEAGGLLTRGADAWRDRRIARVDTSAVERIELARGASGEPTALVRGEGGAWTVAGGQAADSAAVAGLLGELASLRATGSFPSDSAVAAADFASPDAALRLYRAGGGPEGEPSLLLRFVERGDGGWLVRPGARPWTYPYPASGFDRLFPSRARLLGQDGGEGIQEG